MNDDQLRTARRVAYLVTGFIRHHLTPAEREELNEWIAASDDNMNLFARLTDKQNIHEALRWFDDIDMEVAKRNSALVEQRPLRFSVRSIHMQWIAAASIVVVAVVVLLINNSKHNVISGKKDIAPVAKTLIAPGSKKAILITADGKSIDLGDPANAHIRIDDNNQATNTNSVLSYIQGSGAAVMHTLRIPRGGEYELVLPDGTHAWLNAESTLSYPTSFAERERRVSVTGEVYFEVTKDAKKPFRVIVPRRSLSHPEERSDEGSQLVIEVLGTHFNVNAYADLPNEKISLLEGIIQVSVEQQTKKITAGQQVIVQNKVIKVSRNSNIDASNAWVRGKFSFDKSPVSEVLQQLGRWYDVSINYQGTGGHVFTGEIFRNSSLEEVLQMLHLSTGEQYTIHENVVEVRP